MGLWAGGTLRCQVGLPSPAVERGARKPCLCQIRSRNLGNLRRQDNSREHLGSPVRGRCQGRGKTQEAEGPWGQGGGHRSRGPNTLGQTGNRGCFTHSKSRTGFNQSGRGRGQSPAPGPVGAAPGQAGRRGWGPCSCCQHLPRPNQVRGEPWACHKQPLPGEAVPSTHTLWDGFIIKGCWTS